MKPSLSHPGLPLALPFARRLRRNQFVRLTHPARLCVRAERGTLWVTIDGRPDDIQLDPGQSRVFEGDERVLVSALGGAAVLSATRLPSPAPAWRQRLAGWLGQGPRAALLGA